MSVKCDNFVKQEDTLCTLYVNDETNVMEVLDILHNAINISEEKVSVRPMIYDIVSENDKVIQELWDEIGL